MKALFRDGWLILKAHRGIFAGTFLFAMIVSWCISSIAPREYYSKATLDVRILRSEYPRGDAVLSPTPFQIALSTEIIYPVIDNLNLCTVWAVPGKKLSRHEAYERLLTKLDYKELPGRDLIEVGVYSVKRQEAADIANEIAQLWVQKCIQVQEGMLEEVVRMWERRVNLLSKPVDASWGKAAQIYLDLQTQETRLLGLGLAENDPTIEALRTRKAAYRKRVDEQIAAVRNALETEERVQQGNPAELLARENESEEVFNRRHPEEMSYSRPKAEDVDAKRFLDLAEKGLSSAKVKLQAGTAPVRILEAAKPADRPSRPNSFLYLGVAGVVGLVMGGSLACFIEHLNPSHRE